VTQRPSGAEIMCCTGRVVRSGSSPTARGTISSWTGWPDGRARTADCDLVRRATDEEHLAAVAEWFRHDDRPSDDTRRPVIARLYPEAVVAALRDRENRDEG